MKVNRPGIESIRFAMLNRWIYIKSINKVSLGGWAIYFYGRVSISIVVYVISMSRGR